jgi:GxxExxY protein
MSDHALIPQRTEEVARLVVQAAYNVHTVLGPGLLESGYMTCFKHELAHLGLSFREQVGVPIIYRDLKLDGGLRLDILVEECVIVEVKAIKGIHPVFEAQLLSYLKLKDCRLGLLINFHVPLIKQGIRRLVL